LYRPTPSPYPTLFRSMNLAAQTDVDGENDLLDRREAEKLVCPHIARTIDKLVRCEVNGRQALENLLIRDGRRCGRSPHGVNLAGDRKSTRLNSSHQII